MEKAPGLRARGFCPGTLLRFSARGVDRHCRTRTDGKPHSQESFEALFDWFKQDNGIKSNLVLRALPALDQTDGKTNGA